MQCQENQCCLHNTVLAVLPKSMSTLTVPSQKCAVWSRNTHRPRVGLAVDFQSQNLYQRAERQLVCRYKDFRTLGQTEVDANHAWNITRLVCVGWMRREVSEQSFVGIRIDTKVACSYVGGNNLSLIQVSFQAHRLLNVIECTCVSWRDIPCTWMTKPGCCKMTIMLILEVAIPHCWGATAHV